VADETDRVHVERLRAMAMVLPEATEVETFGNPTFRVATTPFAVFERVAGVPVVRVKLDLDEQAQLVQRPGYEAAPDTGHHGWTNIRLDLDVPWSQIDRLVVESYRQQAPKSLRLVLDDLLAAAGEEPLEEDELPVEVDLTPEPVPPRVLRLVTLVGAAVEAVVAAERDWREASEGRRARSRLTVAERVGVDGDGGAVLLLIDYASAADVALDDSLPETTAFREALARLSGGAVEVLDVVQHRTDMR
jgi:predicted DNA-binding protein (MmcQ/YjbR family)